VIFTVRQYGKVVLSADPIQFDSEEEVIKAFKLAKHPDEEFNAKIDDGVRVKYCSFDGDDALILLAVLCYRGLHDEVFKLQIPNCISDDGHYWEFD